MKSLILKTGLALGLLLSAGVLCANEEKPEDPPHKKEDKVATGCVFVSCLGTVCKPEFIDPEAAIDFAEIMEKACENAGF